MSPRPHIPASPRPRLQPWQLGLLHSAPAALGVDEPTRRLVQRNIGESESGKGMTLAGFFGVMAWWESKGWRDASKGPRFWRDQAIDDGAPRRRKAIAQAFALGWAEPGDTRTILAKLDAFAKRQTMHRPVPRATLMECDLHDLNLVIEGLKAMQEAGT